MIHWFKKHPQYLKKESEALNNDPNYRELAQSRNNLLVSHGNIIVRLNKIFRHPIIIVYTDATPYALPLVFPLKNTFTKDEVEAISKLPLLDAVRKILPNVKHYYELRHQNPVGNLCILEWETLDGGASFLGITSILHRVKQWFEGISTGNFPLDSLEVEYGAHFKNVDQHIRFLYPEFFLNEDKIEGEFYSSVFSFIPNPTPSEPSNYIFMGLYMNGRLKSGLDIVLNENLPKGFPEDLKTSEDLFKKSELVERYVSEKKMLWGTWFHLDHEPPPFLGFPKLIEIIGNGDVSIGKERLKRTAFRQLKRGLEEIYIGIRFPNRKGKLEFQLFKITKNEKCQGVLIGETQEAFDSTLDYYEGVQAIVGEKISPSTFHERNGSRADYDRLKKTRANIVGVGAIGSDIADSLGKAGVGSILLMDNQTMKLHNVVRHTAGAQTMGLPKAWAVASVIEDHNPYAKVTVSTYDILGKDINEYTHEESLSIVCIGEDNTESFFNEQAVISNKVAFYVRALRGGKVGRIFRVIPGTDACFHCLSLYRDDNKEFIAIPEDPNNPTLRNECNNPIRPASAADLKLISSIASRLVIEHMQSEQNPHNHWIWSTETIYGVPIAVPYSLSPQFIKPHPQCFYCNHDKQLRVEIAPSALTFMRGLVSQSPDIETGGVLAGYVQDDKIVVTNASEPGPNAVRERTRFSKDVVFCQAFLDTLYKETKGKIEYIGEWHSHPFAQNTPSSTDIKSLTDISFQEGYLTDKPLMIIFSNEGNPSATIHPMGKRLYYAQITQKNI